MAKTVSFELNGAHVRLPDEEGRLLLWALRGDAGLTGPKYGCGEGFCGACTVLLDGEPVRSCSTPLSAVAGKRVITVEGMAEDGRLTALQQAFVEHGAFQCGYCTCGMLLAAHALLSKRHHPSRAEIAAALDGNLCRCGAHHRILAAVEAAARKIGGRP